MTLELNKTQYKTLLTMLYCGEWMLNSHKTKTDALSKKTNDVEQHLFSLAKEAGLAHWIEYDADMGLYFPTADMEDDLHHFIDAYTLRQ